MNPSFDPTRRRLIAAALGTAATTPIATLTFGATAAGAAADRRFVFVILRGGLDGLSAVPAIGDPSFAAARGPLAEFAGAPLTLDNTFALHPNLGELHTMYGRGELAVLHATGLPYRDRSHFDAQQVLESGGVRPYELSTGWLGRALVKSNAKSLALSTAVPLVLRGPGLVDTWAPSALPEPGADLVARLARLYANDPALGNALERAKALHFDNPVPTASDAEGMKSGRGAGNFTMMATRAAEFLAQSNGPQAAVLEVNGWDSHANQAAPNGALGNNLRQLDAGLAALRAGLVTSGTWARTVVVVATEFGREVAVNGTQGTDHGTGAATFVLGGAVAGGRVIADWPGLAPRERNQGRDLKITTDLRAVLKGVLGDHLKVASRTLDTEVFPGSETVRPVGLLRQASAAA
jgi:uncharacterized protein (DUF1501 family)